MEAVAPDVSKLVLRIPARSSHAPLLRAQLRLWLLANGIGDPGDEFLVLASATRAFLLALWRPGPVRTLTIEIEASYGDGIVDVTLHDHAGRHGNTVHFQSPVVPVPVRATASAAQPVLEGVGVVDWETGTVDE